MVSVPAMRIRKQKGLKQSAGQKRSERGQEKIIKTSKAYAVHSQCCPIPECGMDYTKRRRKVRT